MMSETQVKSEKVLSSDPPTHEIRNKRRTQYQKGNNGDKYGNIYKPWRLHQNKISPGDVKNYMDLCST